MRFNHKYLPFVGLEDGGTSGEGGGRGEKRREERGRENREVDSRWNKEQG